MIRKGVRTERNRGAVDIFGRKMNSPFLQKLAIWSWKRQNVITLTTADHDRVQARFTACSSCHHWQMPWFVIRTIVLNNGNFNVSSRRDEQEEAASENFIVGVGSRSRRINRALWLLGWFLSFCFQLRQSSFIWIISDGVVNSIGWMGNVLILSGLRRTFIWLRLRLRFSISLGYDWLRCW